MISILIHMQKRLYMSLAQAETLSLFYGFAILLLSVSSARLIAFFQGWPLIGIEHREGNHLQSYSYLWVQSEHDIINNVLISPG